MTAREVSGETAAYDECAVVRVACHTPDRFPPAQVTRLKAEFATRWSPACATAFAALKDALTSAPVLVLPNLDAPSELIADASECPLR